MAAVSLCAQPPPQESLSDYCWYLTEDGVVGTHRREALNRGLSLAKQVMRTLTEYIQVGRAAKNTGGQGSQESAS